MIISCGSPGSDVPTGRIIYPDSLSENLIEDTYIENQKPTLQEPLFSEEDKSFTLEEEFLSEGEPEQEQKKQENKKDKKEQPKKSSSSATTQVYEEEDLEEAAYKPGTDLYLNLQQYGYSELNINSVSKKYKQTPLMKAASWGDEKAVLFLLERGADVNLQDKLGRTALHLAIWPAHKEIVKLLIQKDPNLALQDNHGNTPLHVAVIRQNVEVVKLLIDKGAPLNIRNNHNQTPLDIAKKLKNQEITEIITRAQTK
ncbi:MAG: ankyrin repeat domain-containing protein [Bacteroidia bacterium]|nr:ankyrin repeat domain-containing protein [Bacteroidia bacterium]MDW8159626.1 ankyrin repeat domain-containing protein [Bacteroidia bacterium]